MTLYVQHGWGKGDKIEEALSRSLVSGVVLSPRDLAPSAMRGFIDALRQSYPDALLLFDPQIYAVAASSPRFGQLLRYPYFPPSGTQDAVASAVLGYEFGLGLDRLISPGLVQTSLHASAIGGILAAASASIRAHQRLDAAPPLLLSLAIDEAPLQDQNTVDSLLNGLTTLEVHGFYVLVRRIDTAYPARFEADALANLMYVVYVLADRNDFEVVCGYSDIVGLLLSAVGAKATATGWYSNLRQFSLRRFEETLGGRARRRYTSRPLLNSVLVVPELQAIHTRGGMPVVLSQTAFDGVFNAGPGNAPWPDRVSYLHHLEVLAAVVHRVSSQGSVDANLTMLEAALQQSSALYDSLRRLGVPFEPQSGPRDCRLHLDAIRRFRGIVGL